MTDPVIAFALLAVGVFAGVSGMRPASFAGPLGVTLAMLLLAFRLRREFALQRWTERALLEGERRHAVLERGTTDLVADVGPDLRLRYVSPWAAKAVIGRAAHELVGRDAGELVTVEDGPVLAAYLASVTADEPAAAPICRARRTDGAETLVRLEARLADDREGLILAVTDVTARRQAETALDQANAQLQRLLLLDDLAGIANRRCFDLLLPKEVARAARNRQPLALLLVEIDRFAAFLDIYGNGAGESCVRAVATAIARQVGRPADLAARFSRETVAILLPETDISGARGVASRLRTAIATLSITHCSNPDRRVTVSIGVAASWPQDRARDGTDLIDLATTALARARDTGGDRAVTEPPEQTLLAAD